MLEYLPNVNVLALEKEGTPTARRNIRPHRQIACSRGVSTGNRVGAATRKDMRLEDRVRGEGKGTYARPPTPIRCFVPIYEHFCEEAAGQESRTPHAQRQSASTMPSICQQDPDNVMGGSTGEVVYHDCSDDPPLFLPMKHIY